MTTAFQDRIDRAQSKLGLMGLDFKTNNDSIFIMIDWHGERLKLWPTTGRWQRGKQLNDDIQMLWRLLGSQPWSASC